MHDLLDRIDMLHRIHSLLHKRDCIGLPLRLKALQLFGWVGAAREGDWAVLNKGISIGKGNKNAGSNLGCTAGHRSNRNAESSSKTVGKFGDSGFTGTGGLANHQSRSAAAIRPQKFHFPALHLGQWSVGDKAVSQDGGLVAAQRRPSSGSGIAGLDGETRDAELGAAPTANHEQHQTYTQIKFHVYTLSLSFCLNRVRRLQVSAQRVGLLRGRE